MDGTRAAILAVAAAFLGVTLIAFQAGRTTSDLPRDAPDFDLPRATGERFKLSDQSGVVLVSFWATWCPPCVAETPSLEALHRHLGPAGLQVVAVSVDGDWGIVQDFQREHGVSYTVLLDPGATTAHRYGTFKYPESFLVAGGQVIRRWIGGVNWMNGELVAELRSILDVKGPAQNKGPAQR